MFHYTDGLAYDIAVHILGTGVMACVPSRINLNFRDVMPGPDLPLCGDDELIALFSQKHNIPMIKLKSERHWMGYDMQLCNVQPYHKDTVYRIATVEAMHAWKKWRLVHFHQ